jgi:hypothetical protein
MSQSETMIAPDVQGIRDAVSAPTRRCGFSPEALRMLEKTIDDVSGELAAEAIADDDPALRTRLAQKLMTFACHGRGDGQAKELLLRAFRNETLAAAANAGHVAAKPWSAA